MEYEQIQHGEYYAGCFHPEKESCFFLKKCRETKTFVLEEHCLATSCLLVSRQLPPDPNLALFSSKAIYSDPSGFSLIYYRRKNFLIATFPSSFFVVWETLRNVILFASSTHGKQPYILSNCCIGEGGMLLFTAIDRPSIYVANLNDAISHGFFVGYKKLALPKRIPPRDMKTHPFLRKVVVGCADGSLRSWDYSSSTLLGSLMDPTIEKERRTNPKSQFGITCMTFSADGCILVTVNDLGILSVWMGHKLGEKNTFITSVNLVKQEIVCALAFGPQDKKFKHSSLFVRLISGKVIRYHYGADHEIKYGDVAIEEPTEKDGQVPKVKQNSHLLQCHPHFAFLLSGKPKFNKKASTTEGEPNVSIKLLGSIVQFMSVFLPLTKALEYPVIQDSITQDLREVLPKPANNPEKKNLVFEVNNLVFYVQEEVLWSYDLADGSASQLISLRESISTTRVRYTSLILRYNRPSKIAKAKENEPALAVESVEEKPDRNSTSTNPSSPASAPQASVDESEMVQFVIGGIRSSGMPLIINIIYDLTQKQTKSIGVMEKWQGVFIGSRTKPFKDGLLFPFSLLTVSPHLDSLEFFSPFGDKKQYPVVPPTRIYRMWETPLRDYHVVMFQLADRMLCLSKNADKNNDLFDFQPNLSGPTFRSGLSGVGAGIQDAKWQSSSGMGYEGSQSVCAVAFSRAVVLLDENLRLLRVIQWQDRITYTSFLLRIVFNGPVLYVQTKEFVEALVIQRKNCQITRNKICTLDSHDQHQLLTAVLPDRLVLGFSFYHFHLKASLRPEQRFMAVIQMKQVMGSQINSLLLGSLSDQMVWNEEKRETKEGESTNGSSLKCTKARENIQNLIQCYEESFPPSLTVLKSLSELELWSELLFLLENFQNSVSIPLKEKLELWKALGRLDQCFSILTKGKDLGNEIVLSELIFKLKTSTAMKETKEGFQILAKDFLELGQFQEAFGCWELTGDIDSIVSYLWLIGAKSTLEQLVKEIFIPSRCGALLTENVLRCLNEVFPDQIESLMMAPVSIPVQQESEILGFVSGKLRISPEEFRSFAEEHPKLFSAIKKNQKQVLKVRNEQQSTPIVKRQIEFGQNKYDLGTWKLTNSNQVEWKPLLRFKSKTFAEFAGYDLYHLQNGGNFKGQGSRAPEDEDEQQSKAAGSSSYSQAEMGSGGVGDIGNMDEDEEFANLVLYWRVDEGKGRELEDLATSGSSGMISADESAAEDLWKPLEEGDPMELEDKWGKICPPQFSLGISSNMTIQSKQPWTSCRLNPNMLSIEFWIKPYVPNGLFMWFTSRASGNSAQKAISFELVASKLRIKIKEEELNWKETEGEAKATGGFEDEEGGQIRQERARSERAKILPNFWTHVAVTFCIGKTITIYLNAVEIGKANSPSSKSIQFDSLLKDEQLMIGGASTEFKGDITEIRCWADEISDSDIKEQFRSPLGIVYDKKKKFKMKLITKPQNERSVPLSSFSLARPPAPVDSPGASGDGISGSLVKKTTFSLGAPPPPAPDPTSLNKQATGLSMPPPPAPDPSSFSKKPMGLSMPPPPAPDPTSQIKKPIGLSMPPPPAPEPQNPPRKLSGLVAPPPPAPEPTSQIKKAVGLSKPPPPAPEVLSDSLPALKKLSGLSMPPPPAPESSSPPKKPVGFSVPPPPAPEPNSLPKPTSNLSKPPDPAPEVSSDAPSAPKKLFGLSMPPAPDHSNSSIKSPNSPLPTEPNSSPPQINNQPFQSTKGSNDLQPSSSVSNVPKESAHPLPIARESSPNKPEPLSASNEDSKPFGFPRPHPPAPDSDAPPKSSFNDFKMEGFSSNPNQEAPSDSQFFSQKDSGFSDSSSKPNDGDFFKGFEGFGASNDNGKKPNKSEGFGAFSGGAWADGFGDSTKHE